MTERMQGVGEAERSVLALEGKSLEELEAIQNELSGQFKPEMTPAEMDGLTADLERVDARIAEMRSETGVAEAEPAEAPVEVTAEAEPIEEPAAPAAEAKRGKKSDKEAAAEEMRAMLEETSVDDYVDKEELESYGTQLVNSLEWARRNHKQDLIEALGLRIEEVKKKLGLGLYGEKRRQRKPKRKSDATASPVAGATAIDVGEESSEGASEEVVEPQNKYEEAVMDQAAKDLPKSAEMTPGEADIAAQRAEAEANGELEEPTPEQAAEQVAAAQAITPEGATPEQAAEIQEAVKKGWKDKAIGAGVLVRDVLSKMSTGAAVGIATKAALRTTLGISGAGLGAVGGAIAAPTRKLVGAGIESAKYDSAQKLIDKGELERLQQRVEVGGLFGQRVFGLFKTNRADALKLLADKKAEMRAAGDESDAYQKIIAIQEKLVENREKVEKLKSFDRLKEYIQLAESAEADEKIEARKAELEEELALAAGRKVTGKQLAKAAMWGAVGGAVGYTVAHYIGGFVSDHFGSHEPQFDAKLAETHRLEHVARAETAEKLKDLDITKLKPQITPTAAQASLTDLSHIRAHAAPLPEHGTVEKKGLVGSLKNIFIPKIQKIDIPDIKPAPLPEIHMPAAPDIHPIMERPFDAADALAKELGVSRAVFDEAHVRFMTVGETINSIADATKVGALPEVGLHLAHYEPTTDELNMTVDEFLRHRVGEKIGNAAADLAHASAAHITPENPLAGIHAEAAHLPDGASLHEPGTPMTPEELNESLKKSVEETIKNLDRTLGHSTLGAEHVTGDVAAAKTETAATTVAEKATEAKVAAAHEAVTTKAETVAKAAATKAAEAKSAVVADTVAAKTEAVAAVASHTESPVFEHAASAVAPEAHAGTIDDWYMKSSNLSEHADHDYLWANKEQGPHFDNVLTHSAEQVANADAKQEHDFFSLFMGNHLVKDAAKLGATLGGAAGAGVVVNKYFDKRGGAVVSPESAEVAQAPVAESGEEAPGMSAEDLPASAEMTPAELDIARQRMEAEERDELEADVEVKEAFESGKPLEPQVILKETERLLGPKTFFSKREVFTSKEFPAVSRALKSSDFNTFTDLLREKWLSLALNETKKRGDIEKVLADLGRMPDILAQSKSRATLEAINRAKQEEKSTTNQS